jgi:peptide/nickel transport system substrate-binding protein
MKKIVSALVAVSALFFLVACGPSAPATTSLVYGTTEKVSDMDPANAYDMHTWEIFQNIFGGLTAYKPGTTELEAGLAESWTANDKGDEYTFVLRKDLKFSNGDVLDANTVKWTIDRNIALKGDPSWLITDFVSSVEVKDATTVVFKLKGPTAFFPALVATPPYFPLDPKVYPVDKIVKDPTELTGGVMVGYGAFTATSFKRDEEVVLDKNPNFYGEKAKIDKIVIRYFADATTLRLSLDKGEVDLAFKSINPSDIADLQTKDTVTTNKLPGPQIRYLTFETSQSIFKKKELRQAIGALVNRPELVQKVYLGQNSPLYSMVPNGMIYQTTNFKDTWGDGNVAKAEELLKAQGYSAAKPFEFDLWYTPSHYGDPEVNMAEVLKAQFEVTKLVKVTLKSAEWATYKEQWKKKSMPVFLLGWYPDYIDPDNYTAAFGGTSGSAGMGINFSDKAWDDLFTKEQTNTDPKVREAAFKDIQARWVVDAPTVPIWQGDLYVFTKKNVTGVKISPTLIFNYNQLDFVKK